VRNSLVALAAAEWPLASLFDYRFAGTGEIAGHSLGNLITVLLVRDLARALARSRARVVLVTNLITEPGETDGYSAADCLAALRRHAPAFLLTMCW
jgi:2-phospho-L-lactate transferase/gluconeogenesis factor (CofD/UPF0052 family)